MKSKLAVFIFVMILMLTLTGPAAFAVTTDSIAPLDSDNLCQKVLYEMVAAENTQDWDTYCNLFTKDKLEWKKEYFQSSKENGVKSVKSAKLVEIQFLDSSYGITEENDKLRNYIIGVDYSVSKEDKYYINGVNYHLITLMQENNEWKVLDYQDAPLEIFIPITKANINSELRASEVVDALPNLNPQNVKTMLNIIDARKAGIIINASGEYLSSNNESVSSAKDAQILLELVQSGNATTASQTRPAWIDVTTVDQTDIGDVGVVFVTYCKDVLPNEWVGSWPSASLKAGGMAVMQYGAYHVIHPRHTDVGCDVCDSDHCQVYRMDSDITACNTAVDAIKGYYYTTSGGTFFETCYAAGSYSSAYGHTGRMRQNGTHYWADQGETWTWMMDYYYSDSDYNIPITSIVRQTW